MKAIVFLSTILLTLCACQYMSKDDLKLELNKSNIEELRRKAFRIENYYRKGEKVFGGLHDYIYYLTKPDVINWIIEKTNEHSELLDKDKFYEITNEPVNTKVFLEQSEITGGGDHDKIYLLMSKLNAFNDEQLKDIAIAVELHMRQGMDIVGGLHDKLMYMNKKDLINWIVEQAKIHKELLDFDKLMQIAKGDRENLDIITEEKQRKKLYLALELEKMTRTEVMLRAFSIENYYNVDKRLGGLHDYAHKMSKEEFIHWIVGQSELHPELLEWKNFMEISNPETLATSLSKEDEEKVEEFIDNIKMFSDEELRHVLLFVENYINRGKEVMQGIMSTLQGMNKEDMMNWLINKAKQNKELLDNKFFQNLVKRRGCYQNNYTYYQCDKDEKNSTDFNDGVSEKLFYFILELEALSIEELKMKALKIDAKYNKDMKGGLHDYIDKLTKEDIIHWITEQAMLHQEIIDNKYLFLDSADLGKEPFSALVGEKYNINILQNMNKDEIATKATELLKYLQLTRGYVVMGGAYDYAHNMSKEQLIDWFMKMEQLYPELFSKEKFEKVINIPKIPKNEENLKEFQCSLKSLDFGTLKNYCIAADKYEKEIKKVEVIGGIQDRIDDKTKFQLIDYLIFMTDKYPELASYKYMNKLVEDFGLKNEKIEENLKFLS